MHKTTTGETKARRATRARVASYVGAYVETSDGRAYLSPTRAARGFYHAKPAGLACEDCGFHLDGEIPDVRGLSSPRSRVDGRDVICGQCGKAYAIETDESDAAADLWDY